MDWTLAQAVNVLLMVNVAFLLALGAEDIFRAPQKQLRDPIVGVYVIAIVFSVSLVAIPLAGWAVTDTAQSINFVLTGTCSGLLFFVARLLRPAFYGLVEVTAGVAGLVAVVFLQEDGNVLVILLALAAAIYVIVRGLSNTNDAFKAKNADAAVAAARVKSAAADRVAEDAEADEATVLAGTFPRNSSEPADPAAKTDAAI